MELVVLIRGGAADLRLCWQKEQEQAARLEAERRAREEARRAYVTASTAACYVATTEVLLLQRSGPSPQGARGRCESACFGAKEAPASRRLVGTALSCSYRIGAFAGPHACHC